MQPEYIFETSWEVCNHVGGIYTVLSTRAAVMQMEHPDKVIFFGPDLDEQSDRYFKEDKRLLRGKVRGCRVGRWQVPGHPIAVLVKWKHLLEHKNELYRWAWEKFGIQSHAAYGDYDDSCLFAYAVGQKMEEVYHALGEPLTMVHMNEWQTAFCLCYIKVNCPKIATLFTTHATSIGRSIAGNGKPLYDYFGGYHGDQMAEELGMVSKHSAEKQAAHHADCFTTVSDLTAKECKQLLDKEVDIVTPNGFEQQWVPQGKTFAEGRERARKALRTLAEKQLNKCIADEPLMVCISGRNEWKNKGIDVFLDAMQCLSDKLAGTEHKVLAFVMVPYLDMPIRQLGNVDVVFVPHYLPLNESGNALRGLTYLDVLMGMDMTVFPSYYEPWGYTPLESVAFHIPTITTSLAGFGVWAAKVQEKMETKPVTVIHRTDSNYSAVVEQTAEQIVRYIQMTNAEKENMRKAASTLSKKADWQHFMVYYKKAYEIAYRNNKIK